MQYHAKVMAGALVIGVVLETRVAPDDAALTFRYAERLAGGHGFTFNDHERVNGASNGLYTLILALLHWLGIPVNVAALSVGVISFVICIGLASWLAASLGGRSAAAVCVAILLLASPFRGNALGGMEAGFSSALGLGVMVELRRRHDLWAGVVLGLALWNKLDAGFLAVAVGLALLLIRRRFPWKVAAAAFGTVSPYLLFCQIYFGGIVPQSALSKLAGNANDPQFPRFNHFWVLSSLLGLVPCGVAVASAVLRPFRRSAERLASDSRREVTLVLVIWPVCHASFLSLVPLGAPWPWYTTVLVPPVAVLSGVGVSMWMSDYPVPGVGWRASAGELLRAVRRSPVAALGVMLVMTTLVFYSETTVRAFWAQPTADDRWQANVRAASSWMVRHVPPHAIIDASCWGYPGYRLPFNPIVDPCRLNSLIPAGRPEWLTVRTVDSETTAHDDFCAVERFGRRGDPEQVVVMRRRDAPTCS